jgi:DnaJ-class molecular chaperone
MSPDLALCSRCEGNGVVKIHHGVSVCDHCAGLGVLAASEGADAALVAVLRVRFV